MESSEKKNGESVGTTNFLQAALLNAVINSLNGNYWWKDIHGVYQECNKKLIALLGFDSADYVVGKTDYEMPWKETAEQLIANDNLVISRKETITYEERAIDAKGKEHIFEVTKAPIFDENNEVIGTIGTSIDITAQKELEKLQLENERQQIALLEEQEKLITLAHKVAHDISSPLSALKMIIGLCSELPESKRTVLKSAIESTFDIANNLLSTYRNKEQLVASDTEQRQPVLISDLLVQLLSEKKVQYSNHTVRFETVIADDAQFVFAQIQASQFRRSVSNLINNAVDAMEDKEDGIVTIQLTAEADSLTVAIEDNGKGMPVSMIEKMLRRENFTEGKQHGHGLGLQQVWDTLDYNHGTITVNSIPGEGTTIQLTFPRIEAAIWIAQTIHLTSNSIIVILDDEESIHGAWDTRFALYLQLYPNLHVYHFKQGRESLDFFNALSPKNKKHVVFLSDYEILRQPKNGLQIIEESGIKNTILVTSYYTNPEIRDKAIGLNVKILPKQMASIVQIEVQAS